MDEWRDLMDDLRDLMDDLRDLMDDLRDLMDELKIQIHGIFYLIVFYIVLQKHEKERQI